MWARCPTVFILLLASPVLHTFDMAALSDLRTLLTADITDSILYE